MSGNFLHAVFSLLEFLTLEAGTDRLSQKVGAKLTLYTAYYFRRVQTSHDLVMQATVWLHMVWFRVIKFSMVWFSTSEMTTQISVTNLRKKTYLAFQ